MAVSPPCYMSTMTDYVCSLHKAKLWKEGAEKVCEDEQDITDKVIIVTGSNQGIGKSTAEELAKRGAKVILAVRTVEKGHEAVDDMKSRIGKDVQLEVMRLDLGDFQSIRDFVKEFTGKYDHLNILVNNAGIGDTTRKLKKTKDGHELHVGTNHLGTYLLTNLLLDSLKRGAVGEGQSKIICVSSTGIGTIPFDLHDIMMEEKIRKGNGGMDQYSLSKLLGAVAMARLAKKLDGSGIKLFQLCPGFVKTNMSVTGGETQSNGFMKMLFKSGTNMVGLTPHQGSETPVFCAVSKTLADDPETGKGEIYRFKANWKKGSELLEKYEKMEIANELMKMTNEWVGLKEE